MRACLLKWSAAVATCLLAGCGVSTGDVSGDIKYDGKPLAGATVTFYDSNNKAISSVVSDEGKYDVKGVATGTAKIAVVTPLAISFPGGLPGIKDDGNVSPKKDVPTIPAKYHDREQSGLKLDVKSGAQIHNMNLE